MVNRSAFVPQPKARPCEPEPLLTTEVHHFDTVRSSPASSLRVSDPDGFRPPGPRDGDVDRHAGLFVRPDPGDLVGEVRDRGQSEVTRPYPEYLSVTAAREHIGPGGAYCRNWLVGDSLLLEAKIGQREAQHTTGSVERAISPSPAMRLSTSALRS